MVRDGHNDCLGRERVQRQDGYTRSLPALLLAVSNNKGGTVKLLRARRSFRPTGGDMKKGPPGHPAFHAHLIHTWISGSRAVRVLPFPPVDLSAFAFRTHGGHRATSEMGHKRTFAAVEGSLEQYAKQLFQQFFHRHHCE
jgi:hypothetical protein